LPVIAEDLLEGVFVDPLPCGDHSAGLYHVLAPRATRVCPLISPSLPIVSPCRDGPKGDSQKRKFLDAQVIRRMKVPVIAESTRRQRKDSIRQGECLMDDPTPAETA